MSIWRALKRWWVGQNKKRRYSYTLGKPLGFRLINLAAQEKRKRKRRASDSRAVNPPYNLEKDKRYQLWIVLSPREKDVTALTCLGYTNSQIAARLGLSIETIRTYLENTFYKSRLRNKADLRVFFAAWDFSEWERRKNPYR